MLRGAQRELPIVGQDFLRGAGPRQFHGGLRRPPQVPACPAAARRRAPASWPRADARSVSAARPRAPAAAGCAGTAPRAAPDRRCCGTAAAARAAMQAFGVGARERAHQRAGRCESRARRRAPSSSVQSQSLTSTSGGRMATPSRRASCTQLRGLVETHRLAVEQRGEEGRGLVALEPAGNVGEQREGGGVRFGKSVFAEAEDLLVDAARRIPRCSRSPPCRRAAARGTARGRRGASTPPSSGAADRPRRRVKSAATTAICITCSWKIGTPSVRRSTSASAGLG